MLAVLIALHMIHCTAPGGHTEDVMVVEPHTCTCDATTTVLRQRDRTRRLWLLCARPKETTPSVRGYQDVIASVRVVNMRDQINLACRLQGPQTPQILHKLYLHVL